jgi:hypothetical protein
MILKERNGALPAWVFTDEECDDYAYICSCMPTDRMSFVDIRFIRIVEVKFRERKGAFLTTGRWDWFAGIANKYASFIQERSDGVAAMRALAASGRVG